MEEAFRYVLYNHQKLLYLSKTEKKMTINKKWLTRKSAWNLINNSENLNEIGYFFRKFKSIKLMQEIENQDRKIIIEEFLKAIKYPYLKKNKEQTLRTNTF